MLDPPPSPHKEIIWRAKHSFSDWNRCSKDAHGNRTTLVPWFRAILAYHALRDINNEDVPGDIVEAGTWRGGVSCFMSRVQLRAELQWSNLTATLQSNLSTSTRRVWLFDTFDGMAEPTKQDDRKSHLMWYNNTDSFCPFVDGKWCKARLDGVRQHVLDRGGYPSPLVHFVKGKVEETLPAVELPLQIAVLRLDTDFYASTAAELKTLWPKLSPGGWLYVDDYWDFGGARKAVLEWLKSSSPSDNASCWWREARRAGAFDGTTRTFHLRKAVPFTVRRPFKYRVK